MSPRISAAPPDREARKQKTFPALLSKTQTAANIIICIVLYGEDNCIIEWNTNYYLCVAHNEVRKCRSPILQNYIQMAQ